MIRGDLFANMAREMGLDLTSMTVDEIRRRYLSGDRVSGQLLSRLKRDPRQGVRKLHDLLRQRYERERGERIRLDSMLNFERVLWKTGVERIAGVDEVGMGPLAGPVVAAAVIFPPGCDLDGVDDSKRLDAPERERLDVEIRRIASCFSIGVAEVPEIDERNIYQAGLLAMRRAIDGLRVRPQHVLVDARTLPDLAVPQNAFCKGDGINFSIAAASIVAKVHRDRMMDELDARHPGYGFARHKGYGTPEHQAALRKLGPCPIHRRSFGFIGEVQGESSPAFYELKDRLFRAGSSAALKAFEQEVRDRKLELAEQEHRKLRTLLARRWKSV